MKLFPSACGNLFCFISKVIERLSQTQQSATVRPPSSVKIPSYKKFNNMTSVFTSGHLVIVKKKQVDFSAACKDTVYHVGCT